MHLYYLDRLCSLVVRVLGYRFRGPGFNSRRYQIFWEVVGLERGPLSLVRIIEEQLENKVAVPVYKTEINGRGDSLRWPRDTLYLLKLAITSPTSGGRSVGIVRWRTKAPELVYIASHSCYKPGISSHCWITLWLWVWIVKLLSMYSVFLNDWYTFTYKLRGNYKAYPHIPVAVESQFSEISKLAVYFRITYLYRQAPQLSEMASPTEKSFLVIWVRHNIFMHLC
jgi:hypothetical protein